MSPLKVVLAILAPSLAPTTLAIVETIAFGAIASKLEPVSDDSLERSTFSSSFAITLSLLSSGFE